MLILVFFLDKLFFFYLMYLPALQYDKRLQYILDDNIDSKVIVLGSSRAARDLLAEDLQNHLNVPCYSLAYPGSNIEFHSFLLKHIVELSKKPRAVLLFLDDPNELVENSNINFRWDRIYPLVKYEEMNRLLIDGTGKSPLLSKIMISIRIKENFPENFFAIPPSQQELLDANGSMPIAAKGKGWDELIFSEANTEPYAINKESERLRNNYLEFIELCYENNIELFLIFPPNFRPLNSEFVQRIQFLTKNKGRFIFYNQSLYRDKELFYNEGHLNRRGAVLFTRDVAAFLKENAAFISR